MKLPTVLVAGAAMSAFFLAVALLSFIWTPYPVETLDISARLQPFGGEYLLGTDHFGRDVLSMLMAGARTSIGVAVLAVGIGMAIGTSDL